MEIKYKKHFVYFPSGCIHVPNVVTQTRFNHRVSGLDIMKTYPYCRRNSKNWRAVLVKSTWPPGAASVYDNSMMMITGTTSARASRYSAEMYLAFIRDAGYPDLEIVDFKVINITTTFQFPGTFDAEKYIRQVDPELLYFPSSFVGARRRTRRTNALLTLFAHRATALGSSDLRSLCYDVDEELKKVNTCTASTGSIEEEAILKRASTRRRRATKNE